MTVDNFCLMAVVWLKAGENHKFYQHIEVWCKIG